MRLLFITNIPSPYRVDFFNELGKHCDLTVIFETGFSDERDSSWKSNRFESFRAVVLNGKKVATDRAFSPAVLKHLKKKGFDKIIVSNIASPTGILAVLYMRLLRISYWVEGDGALSKTASNKLKAFIKRFIISNAQGCFSTSKLHDEYYLDNGAEQGRIFRYPFTSVFEKEVLEKPLSFKEKAEIKNKLSISEKYAVLAVGQFIPRKGFDILVEAAKGFDDIGFYIVGGTPPEEYINLANGRNNIHFLGFMQKEQLSDYYLAADLFVLPTREDIWGLVINEAMAKGLPIITTDKCGAGVELVNDSNGRLIPADSAEALENAIRDILGSEDGLMQMSTASVERIRAYTIEQMAIEHINVLNKMV